MKLITRKTDVQYLSDIEFDLEGEIELLIGPTKKYILCDPRNSGRIRISHPDWIVVETYDERKRLFERARKIEIDADHLPVARWEKLKKLNKHVIAKQQLVSKQRMIKTDVEVEKMIASQRLNERVLEAITPQIQLGMTERDLEQVIRTEILHQGGENWSFVPVVAFEENGANPHHQNTDRKLKKGDQILLDFGSTLGGYCSDMTRILFTDTPTDLQREILDLLISTTESAIKYGKVGMKFSELHRYAANKLGKYKKYFTHSLGHGVGRDIHELPNVSPRRHGNIREGMVFTIEPGIYMPGKIGSRYEQIVVVEDGKLRNVTKARERIQIDLQDKQRLDE